MHVRKVLPALRTVASELMSSLEIRRIQTRLGLCHA